jgi:Streptomyces sporulation and cell division protein, SsgA
MDFNVIRHNAPTTVVSQVLVLELLDPSGAVAPLETELSYDPADPLAVSATFSTVAGQVRWTFGRDLLIEGLVEPVGDGDVHVWPCVDNDGNSVVIIELCSPDGEALVQGRTADITAFVERMTRSVAAGAEDALLDVDAAIAAILAAETA